MHLGICWHFQITWHFSMNVPFWSFTSVFSVHLFGVAFGLELACLSGMARDLEVALLKASLTTRWPLVNGENGHLTRALLTVGGTRP
jgi:hypothetical protein